MILKTFTLQEANGLLPLVREHFFRIHMILSHMQNIREGKNRNLWRLALDKRSSDIRLIKKKRPGKDSFKARTKELEGLIEIEVSGLMKLGVVVKGLLPPHIDFLSMKNNELIFLCWQGGEGEIAHWHYLDDGSPIRHMIAQKSLGPHMVH